MSTIDEIEALLARATPGPWAACGIYIDAPQLDLTLGSMWGTDSESDDRNSKLVIALRDAAPDLIAVVRAAAKVAQHPRFVRANDHGLVEALAKLGVGP